jgi:quercetin dioxygenase-like cupin family protein
MKYEVTPWDGDSTPSQAEIRRIFENENLSPSTWSNGPGDKYSAHSHGYHKVLYCLRGSIVFNVEGASVNLQPGDRLEIPPGTSHSADVGPEGVSCMEAARH